MKKGFKDGPELLREGRLPFDLLLASGGSMKAIPPFLSGQMDSHTPKEASL